MEWLVEQTLIKRAGSLYGLFGIVYPDRTWDLNLLKQVGKTQSVLFRVLQSLFPQHIVEVNYRHPELLFEKSKKSMELDVYVPNLRLAFEYQGAHHHSYHYLYGGPFAMMEKDTEKRTQCERLGITLIEIPDSWNGSTAQIVHQIKQQRPEVLEGWVD